MESPSNPYAAPVFPADGESGRPLCDFAPIIKKWERLRWSYNVFLAIAVLLAAPLTAVPRQLVNPVFWFTIIFGAGVANVCYLMGPAVEGYGSYFGLWRPTMTNIVFVAGTGFTLILALASLAGF